MTSTAQNKRRVQSGRAACSLCLYVAGQSPRSVAALANLKRICKEHLQGRYTIKVIDLRRNPALARADEILAIPTLIRRLPPPLRKIFGDLSNIERVLIGLDIRRPAPATAIRL